MTTKEENLSSTIEINERAQFLLSAICEGRLEDVEKCTASSKLPEALRFQCLCLAAFFDRSAVFKILLQNGFEFRNKSTNECPTLQIASHNSNIEIVEMLLEKCAEVPNFLAASLLYLAVSKGNENVVRLLLNKGVDVHTKVRGPFTSILVAVETQHLDITQHLLMNGADVHSKYPLEGEVYGDCTLLHQAVEKENATLVELLTKYGANVDAKSRNDLTPLHIAADKGCANITRHLIQKRANVNSRLSLTIDTDFSGHKLKENQMLQHFLGFEPSASNITGIEGDETPLHFAVKKGHGEVIKLLLEGGANVDAADGGGNTVLRLAVDLGNLAIVDLVLKYSPSVKDKGNMAAFHLAVKSQGREYREIVEKFIHHGFAHNRDNVANSELLFHAVRNNYCKIVRELLKFGAVVNCPYRHEVYPNSGTFILHVAVKNGNEDMIKILMEFGADANSIARFGFSPLHFAVQDSNVEITKLLLANRASTPIDDLLITAAEVGCLEIITLLLSKGADVTKTRLYRGSWLLYHGYTYRPMRESASKLYIPPADVRTALFLAAQKGHEQSVRFLLENGAEVNFRAQNDVSPYLIAAVGGHLECVKVLLKYGAALEDEDMDGRTALYLAAEFDRKEVVNFLLKSGAKLDSEARNGSTPLLIAAENGHFDLLEPLLKSYKDQVASAARNCDRLLLLAAKKGHFGIVETLLMHTSKSGTFLRTHLDQALFYATKYGHITAVKLLLNFGAKVNWCSNTSENCKTPLQSSAERGDFVIVETLLKCGAAANSDVGYDPTPLYAAAKKGHDKVVDILLKHGAEVDHPKFENARTALFVAAKKGHLKTVEVLLKADATITAADHCDQMNALHVAAQNDHHAVVKVLLKHGAEVDIKDRNGRTPLLISAGAGYFRIVETLLKNGASVESTDSYGLTALHYAVKSGDVNTVRLLLKCGSSVNSKTADGTSPLLISARWGHLDVVNLLLKAGASVDSVLKLAAKDGHHEVMRLLLENGADIDSKTGDVPLLLISAARGHFRNVEVLLQFGADFDLMANKDTALLAETVWKWRPHIFQTMIEEGATNTKTLSESSISNLFRMLEGRESSQSEWHPLADNTPNYTDLLIGILCDHTVKMWTADLFLEENSSLQGHVAGSRSSWCTPRSSFEKEIQEMKEVYVDSTNISLYDILTADLNKLALITRRRGVVKFLKSVVNMEKFPFYYSILNNQIQKGEKRNELLKQSSETCHLLFPLMKKLPYELIRRNIMYHLSNKDLGNFIKVGIEPLCPRACSLPAKNK